MHALKLDKLRKSPRDRTVLSRGKAKLTNRGLVFEGFLDGEKADFDFPAVSIYSLTLATKNFLEFYCNSDYFMIVPDNEERGLIKWTLAAEEIHNLYDIKWRAVCEDVYAYRKEDICV